MKKKRMKQLEWTSSRLRYALWDRTTQVRKKNIGKFNEREIVAEGRDDFQSVSTVQRSDIRDSSRSKSVFLGSPF